MIKLEILRQDVISVEADVLILKHAQSFYGADEAVLLRLAQAGICGANDVHPDDGQAVMLKLLEKTIKDISRAKPDNIV